jgi:peptidoglycan/LPS O-acetylase OafA/YrhL
MKIKYRPEIDGLRCIAVVGVILYHMQINIGGISLFKGGFIGVDIFFVISGYLITLQIYDQIILKKNILKIVKDFYERRARRILPALLLVISSSFIIYVFFLIPKDLLNFSKSILFTLGFFSNAYFHYSETEYGNNSLNIPLLHTWSLSIEEQFYLIFPFFLFFIIKFYKSYLNLIFFFFFTAGLVLSHNFSTNHPSFNFYLLPTRFWEFLPGVLIAIFEKKYKNKFFNKLEFLKILGLFIILCSLFFITNYTNHPSIVTIIPIIGTCLILLPTKDNFCHKILSYNLFVKTGLISYSLYLWHWPILILDRIYNFSNGELSKKILLVVIIILLSIFSFIFVETPFRNKNRINLIYFIKIIAGSYIFLIILNVYIIHTKGLEDRFPKILQSIDRPSYNLLKDEKGNCFIRSKNFCSFNEDKRKKIFLVGDSHLATLAYDLQKKISEKEFNLITIINPGCIYLPNFNKINYITKKLDKICTSSFQNSVRSILLKEKESTVILGGKIPSYINNQKLKNIENPYFFENKNNNQSINEGIVSAINELLGNGNNVILIYPIPEANININKSIYMILKKNLWKIDLFEKDIKENYLSTNYKNVTERNKETKDLFDQIINKKLHKIYPEEIFCKKENNKCLINNSENIFYTDEDHLSYEGSKILNNILVNKILEIDLAK